MYECKDCCKIFNSEEKIQKHNHFVHRPRVYCPIKNCKSFVKSANLRSHFEYIHYHRDLDVECKICHKTVSQKDLPDHHKIDITETKTILKCEGDFQVIYPKVEENITIDESPEMPIFLNNKSSQELNSGVFKQITGREEKISSGTKYTHEGNDNLLPDEDNSRDNFCKIRKMLVSREESLNHLKDNSEKKPYLKCEINSTTHEIELKKLTESQVDQKVGEFDKSGNIKVGFENGFKFQCERRGCSLSFITETELKQHDQKVHFFVEPRIFCPFVGCDKSVLQHNLLRHAKNIHGKSETTCLQCMISIPKNKSFKHLLNHCGWFRDQKKKKLNHHGEKVEDDKDKDEQKKQNYCEKKIENDEHKGQTLQIFHPEIERIILCPDTNCFKILNSSNFDDHIEKYHQDLRRMCCKCNETFSYFWIDEHAKLCNFKRSESPSIVM